MRIADPLGGLAAPGAGGTDIGDAAPGDDDLVVVQPFAGMHRQQTADLDNPIRRPLAERNQQ